MKKLSIPEKDQDAAINLCLDTLSHHKQAIVFVSSKPSAESLAERIANGIKKSDFANYNIDNQKTKSITDGILGAISPPTRQCKREGSCTEKGIAFHHAGLHSQQRELIEDGFRTGAIKIICATPTLAMGVDLPAFRTIIRDLKRYGGRGMQFIPVLEYEQMAGRAGRPGMEEYGEAIIFAQTPEEKEKLVEKFLQGEAEEIYSKLAVEPVLRTYVLSLVASGFIANQDSLETFFDSTFYALQYGDLERLHEIISKMVLELRTWDFLKHTDDEFISASDVGHRVLEASLLGKRVSELYLDPYTAHQLIVQMHAAQAPGRDAVSNEGVLFMISRCLEMRPLPRVKAGDYERIEEFLNKCSGRLFEEEPAMFQEEYDDFLAATKQTLLFLDWIDEKHEEELLERYSVRPGELRGKLENADWLLYAASELGKLNSIYAVSREATKLRIRLEYGAREELLPLLRLKGIGKIRARMLYQRGIKDLGDVKSVEASTLISLLGKQLAIDIKKQVGEEIRPEFLKVKENKRKGQINLMDYDDNQSSN